MDRDNLAVLGNIAPPEATIRLFGDIALGTGEDIPDPYYGGQADFEPIYTMPLIGCSRLLETLGAERASCSGNTSSVR
ncbi:tyrosine phosphatase [Rhizobium sp. CCGE 510]|nr:tyrosine phosphatase [Rhizobium sp. CCGE 510]